MHLLHHHQDAAAWVKLIALFKQCHAKHCGRISFEIRSMGSSLATSYLIITYFFCISLNSSCIACSPPSVLWKWKLCTWFKVCVPLLPFATLAFVVLCLFHVFCFIYCYEMFCTFSKQIVNLTAPYCHVLIVQ